MVILYLFFFVHYLFSDKIDWEQLGGIDAVKAKIKGNDEVEIKSTIKPEPETPPPPHHKTDQKPEAKPRFSDSNPSRFSNTNLQRKPGYGFAFPTRAPYQANLRSRYKSPYNDYSDYYRPQNSQYDWRNELADYESNKNNNNRQSAYPSWLSNSKPQQDNNAWYDKQNGRSYGNSYNDNLFNYDYDNLGFPGYDKYEPHDRREPERKPRPQFRPLSESHQYAADTDSMPAHTAAEGNRRGGEPNPSEMANGNQHVVDMLSMR